jgi:nitronate monooxygenase
MGTLPLLADVLDRVDVPVLAAGGITSARGLAAVLAAGASGAWLGTVFCTCAEASTPPEARVALLAASGESTTLTDEFDRAQGYPWPPTIPERVLRGADGHPVPVNAGQGVGMVTASPGAGELVVQLCVTAESLLRELWHRTAIQ